MEQNCSICGTEFTQAEPLYLICRLCHLVTLLKAFPSNCFTKAYNEHMRVKAKAVGA